MRERLWRTKFGVLVRLRGREVNGKVEAYRYPSGGYAGLLWKCNLRPEATVAMEKTEKPEHESIGKLILKNRVRNMLDGHRYPPVRVTIEWNDAWKGTAEQDEIVQDEIVRVFTGAKGA